MGLEGRVAPVAPAVRAVVEPRLRPGSVSRRPRNVVQALLRLRLVVARLQAAALRAVVEGDPAVARVVAAVRVLPAGRAVPVVALAERILMLRPVWAAAAWRIRGR